MKKTSALRGFTALVILCCLFFLNSCGSKPVHTENTYTKEDALLVSHVTGGIIDPGSVIAVRFVEPPKSSVRDRALKSNPFSFSPDIRGKAAWTEDDTLVFKPVKPLKERSAYTGVLDLSFLEEKAAGKESIEFSFSTMGTEITGFTGEFITEKSDSPEDVRYSGEFSLNFFKDPEILSRAIQLNVNGKEVPVEIAPQNKETGLYKFSSSLIARNTERKEVRVTFKKELGLSDTYVNTAYLEPIDVFTVTDIKMNDEGRSAGIQVKFTDQLDTSQNIEGLISVEPYEPVSIKTYGKDVYLQGDFKRGEKYTVNVRKNIKSSRGTKTAEQVSADVEIEDVKPQMEFIHSGVFLPSTGNSRIYLKTVNLRKIDVSVIQVFENNLGQFLQTEQLSSSSDRNSQFNYQYVNRVGVPIAETELTIGEEKNKWLVQELDLSSLIDPEEKGLYLVSVTFDREDMIYPLDEEQRYYHGDDYYSNPNSRGYLYTNGRIYKPVMVSDIGLTWKAGSREHAVYATDLITASPLQGVRVTLRTYQNQIIAQGITDSDGTVTFGDIDRNAFYMTGERGNQRSVVKANEMAWNLSSFNTGGSAAGDRGTRAFLYTDRGVYRPGDTVQLGVIVRNRDNTFPDDHPVELTVYNPQGQVYSETTTTSGKDGFYHFEITTQEADPTGTWTAYVTAGSETFSTKIRIETIVPNRLKVNLSPVPEGLDWRDDDVDITLSSSYLFGAPAASLEAEIDAEIQSREKSFEGYPGFRFSSEISSPPRFDQSVFRGNLSPQGTAQVSLSLPSFSGAPSALDLVLHARVLEKGGRAVHQVRSVPVNPYRYYAGVKKPEMKYGYAQIGSSFEFPYILVDSEGNPASGKSLSYRIYRNERYWWWEYDSYDEYKARYKSDSYTELIKEGTVISKQKPGTISFAPEQWGEYYAEVVYPGTGEDGSGHSAGFFFRASAWSDQPAGADEGTLSITTDKESYNPGEIAEITMITPDEGRILLTLERDGKIISSQWRDPARGETKISIPISRDMLPTTYAAVSLIQPHGQSENDRPIRMYGIVPLNVIDPQTKQELSIITEPVIEPDTDFYVTVQTKSGRPTQFTLAVVDEGLLDLTNFPTPDPWSEFYSKQRLSVRSYDLFSQVIGVFKGDVFKTFSIGGGEGEMMMAPEEGAEAERSRRFEPVALFKGPLKTDPSGKAVVKFHMPNYVGSVRIMAVSASGDAYGSASKAVPVRSDVVMLPTLPRVLGPGEEAIVPINLFALAGNLGPVTVRVRAEGPVNFSGSTYRTVWIDKDEERDVFFDLETENAVGPAKIFITLDYGNKTAQTVIPINVRASSTPLTLWSEGRVEPDNRTSLSLPEEGIKGSNKAVLTIHKRENLHLSHRYNWLIRYPYGCIEQTVSAVFPQLYLKDFISADNDESSEIDRNINEAIKALRKFQLPSGGFTYWPGRSEPSSWGTNYAGHFLIEASVLGYHVPKDMISNWLRFQNNAALSSRDDLTTRLYRLYLLALSGEGAVGAMNLIKENSLHELRTVERWMLASSYYLTGMENTADTILRNAGIEVEQYQEFGGTYGSTLRDQAIILEQAVMMERSYTADLLFESVSEIIAGSRWLSTQETGYSLLAMGKYLESMRVDGDLLAGTIILPDGREIPFSTRESVYKKDLTEYLYNGGAVSTGNRKSVTVEIDPITSAARVFPVLQWEGLPLKPEFLDESKNIDLTVNWYDNEGRKVDVTGLTQGKEFWARITVQRPATNRIFMEELALTQMIPSGWEIINTRLTGEENPWWMRQFSMGSFDYMDIRDDRVSWFFDMPSHTSSLDFVFKVQAVTAGTFFLPPTSAEAMYRKEDYYAVLGGRYITVKERE